MIYDAVSRVYQRITIPPAELTALPTIKPDGRDDEAAALMSQARNFQLGGPGTGAPLIIVSRVPSSPGEANDAAIRASEQWERRETYVHKALLKTSKIATDMGFQKAQEGIAYHFWMFLDGEAVASLPEDAGLNASHDCMVGWATTKTSDGSTYMPVRDKMVKLSETELCHFQVNPSKRRQGFGRVAMAAIHQFDAGQQRTTLECLKTVVPFYRACGFVESKEDMGQIPSLSKYTWMVRERVAGTT